MKIKYSFGEDFEKCYSETISILLLKGLIKSSCIKKVRGFLFYTVLIMALMILIFTLLGLVFILIGIINFNDFMSTTISSVLFFVFSIFFIKHLYNKVKNPNEALEKGILELNENGIIDKSSNGIMFGYPYEEIEMVVFTDDAIVFVSKKFSGIFISNSKKYMDKIINKLEAYCDVTIIDKTSR